MENCHQEKISADIHHTGDHNGEKRRFGISDPSKYSSQYIISNNKKRTAAADGNIMAGLVKGFRRGMKGIGKEAGTSDHEQSQQDAENNKKTDPAADGSSSFFWPLASDPFSYQYSDTHRKTGDDHSYCRQEHTSCGHSRYIGSRSKLSDYQKIHSSVKGLQEQSKKYRDRETDQSAQDISLCETVCFCHDIPPKCFRLFIIKKAG